MNRRKIKFFSIDSLQRAFSAWLTQHAQALVFSVGQLYKNPVGSFLTTAVVGISLALPAGFYMVLENVHHLTANWDGAVRITLFLNSDVPNKRAIELTNELNQLGEIENIRYISPNEALAEYQQVSGFGNIVDTLGTNPLPSILLLQPDLASLSSGQAEKLLITLRHLPEVDTAQFDRQWVKRLFAIIEILQRAVIIMATLLAIAVLLIIGNTIRLAIYNRRAEIEINKLFGATNAFIQRPFLYNGLVHGLAGSFMSWLLLESAVLLLQRPVADLASMYYSSFELYSLNLKEVLLLFLAGALLGLAGSWLSMRRHLRDIEPV